MHLGLSGPFGLVCLQYSSSVQFYAESFSPRASLPFLKQIYPNVARRRGKLREHALALPEARGAIISRIQSPLRAAWLSAPRRTACLSLSLSPSLSSLRAVRRRVKKSWIHEPRRALAHYTRRSENRRPWDPRFSRIESTRKRLSCWLSTSDWTFFRVLSLCWAACNAALGHCLYAWMDMIMASIKCFIF